MRTALVFLASVLFATSAVVANDSTKATDLKISGFIQSRATNQNGETTFPARVRFFLFPANVVSKNGLRLTGETSLDFKYNKGQILFSGLNSLYLTVGLESHPNYYLLLGRRLNPKDFYLPPPNKFWFVDYPRAASFGPSYANAILLQKDGGLLSGMVGVSDNGGTSASSEGYHGSDFVWRTDLVPKKSVALGFSGRVGKQTNGRRDIVAADLTWQNHVALLKVGFSSMKNQETSEGWWFIAVFNLPSNLQLLTLAESFGSDDETTYGYGCGLRLTVAENSLAQINVQKSAGRGVDGKRPKVNTALTFQIAF